MELPLSPVWVVQLTDFDDMAGRLGDARELADRLETAVVAVVCTLTAPSDETISILIQHGADLVVVMRQSGADSKASVSAVMAFARSNPPRFLITPGDRGGRAWSARLAACTGWPLVSPALRVQFKQQRLTATQLDSSGRKARTVDLPGNLPAIVALAPGVAQPLCDSSRTGVVQFLEEVPTAKSTATIASRRLVPADPAVTDIRHLPKLISGGRGVGSRGGFEVLRKLAEKLGAGVAASRAAVDLGWIEPERQVGQTGKTVTPDLYLACGISGATHHLEGMSASRHIVAINTDPQAPLMQLAHLAIQGELHEILRHLDRLLERTA